MSLLESTGGTLHGRDGGGFNNEATWWRRGPDHAVAGVTFTLMFKWREDVGIQGVCLAATDDFGDLVPCDPRRDY